MERSPTPSQNSHIRSKIVRVIANVLFCVIGLSAGAAIVHGMVYQQCATPKDGFIAGALPSDLQIAQTQEQNNQTTDSQKCLNNQGNPTFFEAGVLPSDINSQETATSLNTNGASNENISDNNIQTTSPSVQGELPLGQKLPPTFRPVQTSAPAPSSEQNFQPIAGTTSNTVQPASPIPDQNGSQAVQPAITLNQQNPTSVQNPQAQPTPKTEIKNISPPTPPKKSPQTLGVDLDKLSLAVAMTETHNCQDKVGSALYNNCYGIKKNGGFMHFDTPEQSTEYFKQLWAKSYKIFPTYRLAQIYSGNDHPTQWLKNVTYYYYNL